MNRRQFLQSLEGAILCSSASLNFLPPACAAEPATAANDKGGPLVIGAGPHLLLDDHLLDKMEGVRREMRSPERLDKPVLDSQTFGTSQPYLSVVYDQDEK